MSEHLHRNPDPAVMDVLELKASDGDTHVTCCDEMTALCGEDLSEGEWADGEPTDCIRCEVIDDANVPCGAKFCRLRSWWRSR